MISSTLKAAVFDWDGVVIDTFPIYYHYLKALCDHFKRHCPFSDLADYRQQYIDDKPFEELYTKCGFCWQKGARDDQEIRKFYQEYMATQEIALVEGMAEMVKTIERDSGLKLAIATSNARAVIEDHLKRFDLEDEFIAIASAHTENLPHKPAPDILLRAATMLQLAPEEMIYIGDQPLDIKAAHAAGMRVGAVTWGYCTEERLRQFSPDYIFRTPQELYRALVGSEMEKKPTLF